MDKLKMETNHIVNSNLDFIASKFPNCIVEIKNEKNEIVKAIDFEMLKQELSNDIIDGSLERYVMSWPDKRNSIVSANLPTSKTLRPCYEESVNYDTTKNLYLEGDNLEVLKIIRETYLNKIKLIYIDPPYNAGADLLYKNNYEMNEQEFKNANFDLNEDGYIMSLNTDTSGRYHTDWLNMMYSRIKIARDMLSEDGCMVIAIDHNELANIIKIADEIFSERNRIGIVTVVHKPEGRNMDRYFATSNEFALFYAKNLPMFDFEDVILDDEYAKQYSYSDEKGKYRANDYVRLGGGDHNLRVNKPHFYYPIYVSPDLKVVTLEKIDGYYEIYPNTKTQERTWKTKKETTEQAIKNNELFAEKDESGNIKIYEKYRKGQLIKTHWVDKKYNAINSGTKILDDIMETRTFDFPKSLYLMEDIINMTTKKDSIILDFFSGSSTTAHATMLLNSKDGGKRQFIMIQLPWKCDEESDAFKAGYKTIPEIAKERIRRSGRKLQENCQMTAPNLDVGFRVLKLDSSCMKDVYYSPNEINQNLLERLEDNIKEDRSAEDLLFQVMLDMGVVLSSDIKAMDIQGKKVFNVNDGNLVCCFDKNLTDEVVTEIAKMQPLYAVFRDASMSSDSVAVNFDQIFETYSPTTTRKII